MPLCLATWNERSLHVVCLLEKNDSRHVKKSDSEGPKQCLLCPIMYIANESRHAKMCFPGL